MKRKVSNIFFTLCDLVVICCDFLNLFYKPKVLSAFVYDLVRVKTVKLTRNIWLPSCFLSHISISLYLSPFL